MTSVPSAGAGFAASPLFQLGYVPRDINAALKYWTRSMGVGPFFVIPHIPYEAAFYRGAETNVDCTIYIAYWGDIQIELVEQHSDAASIYTEWLEAGSEGLHHLCYRVDDIERSRDHALQVGGTIVQELFVTDGRIVYVDFGAGPGSILEILQTPSWADSMYEMMRTAAATWTGEDPVRRIRRGQIPSTN